jgi:hypothetical protein
MIPQAVTKEDFENYYLITWGIVIKTAVEAMRFVLGARNQMGLTDTQILKFLEGLYIEGVAMSEEYALVDYFLGKVEVNNESY